MAARIMIVAGDVPMLVLLSYNVAAAGHTVETLASGQAVQSRVSENPPDLLVLDWFLPGLSGIQLCRRLRRAWTAEQLPILIVGANNDPADREYALANGACEFLPRSFAVKVLHQAVHQLLAHRPVAAAE